MGLSLTGVKCKKFAKSKYLERRKRRKKEGPSGEQSFFDTGERSGRKKG